MHPPVSRRCGRGVTRPACRVDDSAAPKRRRHCRHGAQEPPLDRRTVHPFASGEPTWLTFPLKVTTASTTRPFDDVIDALAGDDIIFGEDGDDTFFGNLGNDVLFGGAGSDRLEGGDGNDLLSAAEAFPPVADGELDILIGGANSDRYFVFESQRQGHRGAAGWPGHRPIRELQLHGTCQCREPAVRARSPAGHRQRAQQCHDGDQGRRRQRQADGRPRRRRYLDRSGRRRPAVRRRRPGHICAATAATTCIDGGSGNDFMVGADGADTLKGGVGDDLLSGGALGDRLTGGAGSDRFQYTGLAGGPFGSDGTVSATRDTITDFTKGQDRIDVHLIDANGSVFGVPDFTFIGGSGFTAAGQIRAFTTAEGTVIQGSVDFGHRRRAADLSRRQGAPERRRLRALSRSAHEQAAFSFLRDGDQRAGPTPQPRPGPAPQPGRARAVARSRRRSARRRQAAR